MKKTIILAFLLLFSINCMAQSQKATIVSFVIMGAQNTELQSLNGSDEIAFNERIYNETLDYLKREFNLDSINSTSKINIKNNINRLSGVKKLSKNELENTNFSDVVFKIKCDISFNETNAGFLTNQPTSRAFVYLSIGVFNNKGEFLDEYKAKTKDNIINIGRNQVSAQWLSLNDFYTAYSELLTELVKQ